MKSKFHDIVFCTSGDKEEIVALRRAQADSSRTDILSLLLSARDEAGELMTDQELRDELLTLLIAGQETTATALAWALYWIHSNYR